METAQTLKIGFKNYKVEKSKEIGINTEYYGIAHYEKAMIRILDNIKQHDKNCTLIHEMLHCICMRFGLTELNNNEHTIEILATGIYEAIIDNPGIFTMKDI